MLDGEPHTIVGVMPAGMRFPSRTTDVWLPLGLFVQTFPADRGAHPGLFAVAKLKAGHRRRARVRRHGRDCAPPRAAVSDVEHRSHRVGGAVLRADRGEHPAGAARALGRGRVRAAHRLREPGEPDAGARRRPTARDRDPRSARRQPAADRAADADRERADGARRRRARRAAGLVGRQGVRRLASGSSVPRIDLVAVDLRVLAFATVVSIATGIAFGLAPALRASSVDLLTSLKDAARGTAGAGRRTRSALVVAEVALALVLLVGAGLTIRSFAALTAIDLGFDPSHVVTMRVSLPNARYPELARWSAFHRELLRRTAGDPRGRGGRAQQQHAARRRRRRVGGSVRRPAAAELAERGRDDVPLPGGVAGLLPRDGHRGRPRPRPSRSATPPSRCAGRRRRRSAGARSSSRMHDPIGKRIAFEFTAARLRIGRPIWREVVGVVRHVRHYGLVREPANLAGVRAARAAADLVPRSPADDDAVRADAARAGAARRVDQAGRCPASIATSRSSRSRRWSRYVAQPLEQSRLNMTLLGLFGGLALVLASLGIYGVLSYSGQPPHAGDRDPHGARRDARRRDAPRSSATGWR